MLPFSLREASGPAGVNCRQRCVRTTHSTGFKFKHKTQTHKIRSKKKAKLDEKTFKKTRTRRSHPPNSKIVNFLNTPVCTFFSIGSLPSRTQSAVVDSVTLKINRVIPSPPSAHSTTSRLSLLRERRRGAAFFDFFTFS